MSIAGNANYAGIMEIPNLRRLSVSELVYKLQDIELDLHYYPGAVGINKTVYQARLTTEIQRELQRRQDMPNAPINTDVSVIKAIKERAGIVEVLENFTEVYLHQKLWTFKCPLHSDEHPSGKIYPDQNKAWCYQCSQGGDAIDTVMLFGKTDIKGAISWLCKFYGISPQVIPTPELSPEDQRFEQAFKEGGNH